MAGPVRPAAPDRQGHGGHGSATSRPTPSRCTAACCPGCCRTSGCKDTARRDYLGARNARFAIFPGSALFKKQPPVRDGRRAGRDLAAVGPGHRRHRARVGRGAGAAPGPAQLQRTALGTPTGARWWPYERVTLYGVPLVAGPQGRLRTASIPRLSRELFIRHALVEGDWHTRHHFFAANRALVAEVQDLENRARRRDLLIDDDSVFAFYDQRIPASVVSGRHFDAWWKKARHQHAGPARPDRGPAGRAPVRRARHGRAVPRPVDVRRLQRASSATGSNRAGRDDGVTVDHPAAGAQRGRRRPAWTGRCRDCAPSWSPRCCARCPSSCAVGGAGPGHGRCTGRRPRLTICSSTGRLTEYSAPSCARCAASTFPRCLAAWTGCPTTCARPTGCWTPTARCSARARIWPSCRRGSRPAVTATAGRAPPRTWPGTGSPTGTSTTLPRTVRREVAGHPVTGYPALVDENGTVAIRVLDSAAKQRAADGDRHPAAAGQHHPVAGQAADPRAEPARSG